MKTLIIIILFSTSIVCQGQMVHIDTIFNVDNLHLEQSLIQERAMLPYQMSSGGIIITTFLINETIIRNAFAQAQPWEIVNVGPETLSVYITGVSLALVVMVIGFYLTY